MRKSLFLILHFILLLSCQEVDFERKIKVKTAQVEDIEVLTAVLIGKIIDVGEGIYQHGHCWSESTKPQLTGNKTDLGNISKNEIFLSSITDLKPGTTYYARAYASDGKSVIYGDIISFTTKPPTLPLITTGDVREIDTTSVKIYSDLISFGIGQDSVIQYGYSYAQHDNPNKNDSTVKLGSRNIIGAFNYQLRNLLPGTKYYIKAYAMNDAGFSYGDTVSFTTLISLPKITTADVISVTNRTAISGGDILPSGGGNIINYGVCWDTVNTPNIYSNKTVDGSTESNFISHITNLIAGKTYYLRAYATNSAGTSYGDQKIFKTIVPNLPTVRTKNILNISFNETEVEGEVINDGGADLTSKGVCWSKSEYPTIADSKTISDNSLGSFLSVLADIEENTVYFVRAFATNSAGTGYGEQLSFKTLSSSISLSTTLLTNDIYDFALLGVEINYDGSNEIISKGICWSEYAKPTINDSVTYNEMGENSFESSVFLTKSGIYYARAFAISSSDTVYGNDIVIRTNLAYDGDGNMYNWVKIGNQIWISENLKTTRYCNGEEIGTTASIDDNIYGESSPKYQWSYNGDESISEEYGRLYTWFVTTDQRNVCPCGWRVPTDKEWAVLINFLGGTGVADEKLKETGNEHWTGSNLDATNETGFSALAGGYRYFSYGFSGLTESAVWWGATMIETIEIEGDIWHSSSAYRIYYDNSWVYEGAFEATSGLSIRCIKD